MIRFMFISLVLLSYVAGAQPLLVDKNATAATKTLYHNLKTISEKGMMFGHQDDDAYGVGWFDQPGRSDVKEVCGAYPAVHGWDLGKIEYNRARNLDSVSFEHMHTWIRNVYEREGVNTISWHPDNPVTGKSAWDKTPAVKAILPGGDKHTTLISWLDNVATFLQQCQAGNTAIPIIFRPWHEHNGDWFWWGKGNCTEEEYIKLWRFTIDYLVKTKGLHNLIFAFSPDRSRMDIQNAKTTYLYAYPGDDYVDIIGLDNYHDIGKSDDISRAHVMNMQFETSLKTITNIAKEKNKVAALTETGLVSVTNPNWYTEIILTPLIQNPDIHIAYMLVWRNYKTSHHYAPYKGHPAEKDFLYFYNNKYTLFENNIRHIYDADKFTIEQ